jgi:hypothetical protein
MNVSRHPFMVSKVLASVATWLVLAAPALGQVGGTLTPNQLGTPDDGVICRSGYTIPFASPRLLWRMKAVTHREKDAGDLVVLRHWFAARGETPPAV